MSITSIILTDHKWKRFKYGYEAPRAIQEDYKEETDGFILYRKRWYNLSDFTWLDANDPYCVLGYNGYYSDSPSRGVLIQVSKDGETYKIAAYIS